LSSINHYNLSKSDANSSLPDAYSMLHMHHQSYNPLMTEVFNICYPIDGMNNIRWPSLGTNVLTLLR